MKSPKRRLCALLYNNFDNQKFSTSGLPSFANISESGECPATCSRKACRKVAGLQSTSASSGRTLDVNPLLQRTTSVCLDESSSRAPFLRPRFSRPGAWIVWLQRMFEVQSPNTACWPRCMQKSNSDCLVSQATDLLVSTGIRLGDVVAFVHCVVTKAIASAIPTQETPTKVTEAAICPHVSC